MYLCVYVYPTSFYAYVKGNYLSYSPHLLLNSIALFKFFTSTKTNSPEMLPVWLIHSSTAVASLHYVFEKAGGPFLGGVLGGWGVRGSGVGEEWRVIAAPSTAPNPEPMSPNQTCHRLVYPYLLNFTANTVNDAFADWHSAVFPLIVTALSYNRKCSSEIFYWTFLRTLVSV